MKNRAPIWAKVEQMKKCLLQWGMQKHLQKWTLYLATMLPLVACDASSVPTSPKTFDQAVRHGVSFTEYAVTTQVIIANAAGCDQFSGGWQDEKNIQNLLFVGDEKYQKWASPGKFVQDTVAMALFWDRKVRFVFACKKQGQVTYHHTEWGTLDREAIEGLGNNLVLRSRLDGNKVQFLWNYPLNP